MSKAGKSTSKVLSSWTPLNNEESNKKVYYERRELFCKWVSGVNIWRSKFLPKMKPMHFADIVSYDWPCVSPNQVTCKNPAKREDSSFPTWNFTVMNFYPLIECYMLKACVNYVWTFQNHSLLCVAWIGRTFFLFGPWDRKFIVGISKLSARTTGSSQRRKLRNTAAWHTCYYLIC